MELSSYYRMKKQLSSIYFSANAEFNNVKVYQPANKCLQKHEVVFLLPNEKVTLINLRALIPVALVEDYFVGYILSLQSH